MTRPLVVFGDAAAELANLTRTLLADRTERYVHGVIVRTRIPEDRRPADLPPPLVVFRQDGPAGVQNSALARCTLRATVWHRYEDDAFDLAQLVRALIAHHSGTVIRSLLDPMAPSATTDPDTGEPLASFTMTANLRPRVIT